MKPSPSPNPRVRITCQVVRFWSGVRSEDAPPAHHLATCESCRQFLVSSEQLQLGLRREAMSAVPTAATELEQRLIEAIRFSPPATHEASPQHRGFLTLTVAGGAAALVLAGLWHYHLTPFYGQQTAGPTEYTAEVAALVAAVRSIPSDLSRNLEAPATQLAADNSLGREVENVYSDARSALNFLALNFLPTSAEGVSRDHSAAQATQQRT